jgi:hypothetical protein
MDARKEGRKEKAMKSLMMILAGAGLVVAALGSTGCVVDWQSQGSIVVHRQVPAGEQAAPAVYESCPASAPVYYAPPPPPVVVVRSCPPPVVYLPAPRPCPPPVFAGRRGLDISVRTYRK